MEGTIAHLQFIDFIDSKRKRDSNDETCSVISIDVK